VPLGRLPERLEVQLEHLPIQRGGAARLPVQRHVHLHVAARDSLLDNSADLVLDRIELGRQMEMEVERPVIDALEAHDDLARVGRAPDPGKARHAADAHRSTTSN
jgi:hypothetical protein